MFETGGIRLRNDDSENESHKYTCFTRRQLLSHLLLCYFIYKYKTAFQSRPEKGDKVIKRSQPTPRRYKLTYKQPALPALHRHHLP